MSQTYKNLCYRITPQRPLLMDLRLPEGCRKPPLILYIPMGGMRECRKDRESVPWWIVERGFALASIECRVSDEAIAPTQIWDCMAAVRWLRAHADEFGFRPGAIGAWGHSAGGMLAALLATAGDSPALRERGAENADISTQIQAVCDSCGAPHDITSFADPAISAHYAPVAENLRMYLGGSVGERLDLARSVSPATYISRACPPLLLIQGERDQDIPPRDIVSFHQALLKAGVDSTLRLLPDVGHGWPIGLAAEDIVAFFRKTLGGAS